MALAECCLRPGLIGATVRFGVTVGSPHQDVATLFAEGQSRIIVTVREKDLQPLLKLARLKKCPTVILGTVGGDRLKINDLIDVSVEELEQDWKAGFERALCVA